MIFFVVVLLFMQRLIGIKINNGMCSSFLNIDIKSKLQTCSAGIFRIQKLFWWITTHITIHICKKLVLNFFNFFVLSHLSVTDKFITLKLILITLTRRTEVYKQSTAHVHLLFILLSVQRSLPSENAPARVLYSINL